MTKEIISLQIGHYANYIGTHFWNLQTFSFNYNPNYTEKTLNHDVFFREGKTNSNEVTFTPRCIIVDLKGSLFSLKKDGYLYEQKKINDKIAWSGPILIEKQPQIKKNKYLQELEDENYPTDFQDLDLSCANDLVNVPVEASSSAKMESEDLDPALPNSVADEVNTWTDFLRPYLHPKTIHIINQYQHNNTEELFNFHGQGCETYQTSKDDLENQLHFFSEDCDYLQGFNILCDTYDGFGGILHSFYNDIIYDDFKSKTSLIYSVRPPFEKQLENKYEMQLLSFNSILSYVRLLNNNAFVLPLSVNRSLLKIDNYQQDLLQYNPELPYESSSILSAAAYNTSLPLTLHTNPLTMFDWLNPLTTSNKRVISMNCCFPFEAGQDWMAALEVSQIQSLTVPHLSDCWTIPQQVCMSGVKDLRPESAINFIPMKIKFENPFPNIFKNNTQTHPKWHQLSGMVTSIQSSPGIEDHLGELLECVEKGGIKRLQVQMGRVNIEADEVDDTIEQFKKLIFAYNGEEMTDM